VSAGRCGRAMGIRSSSWSKPRSGRMLRCSSLRGCGAAGHRRNGPRRLRDPLLSKLARAQSALAPMRDSLVSSCGVHAGLRAGRSTRLRWYRGAHLDARLGTQRTDRSLRAHRQRRELRVGAARASGRPGHGRRCPTLAAFVSKPGSPRRSQARTFDGLGTRTMWSVRSPIGSRGALPHRLRPRAGDGSRGMPTQNAIPLSACRSITRSGVANAS